MTDALVRLLGWRATIIQGDVCVLDRYRWLRRHLRPGRLRTLDAGCGSGAFTMYAARRGNEAMGISNSSRDIEVAVRRASLLGLHGARFVQGDLRRLDKEDAGLGTFDQVICFETIEHIIDDRKLVADLARLMRPGARLLLTSPNLEAPPLEGDKLSEVEDGGHVRWGYTHAQLGALLKEAGLEVVAMDFVSGPISRALTTLGRRLSRLPSGWAWAILLPLRPLVLLEPLLRRVLRRPSISVAVVARKPEGGAADGRKPSSSGRPR